MQRTDEPKQSAETILAHLLPGNQMHQLQARVGRPSGTPLKEARIVILRCVLSQVSSRIAFRPSLVESVNRVCCVNHHDTILVCQCWHRLIVPNVSHNEVWKRLPIECS